MEHLRLLGDNMKPSQAWKVDLAAGTVTVNGVTKAITSGTLTIS